MTEKPIALLLLGPTASGKSALSLKLAEKYPVEIISIDSALVYRGMDIGSAKPTEEELRTDCTRLVHEIRGRNRIPLIVGGTMLYAKALREGIDEMPTTSPEIRAGVAEEAEKLGWPAMHEMLRICDPETAARLAPNDKQRIGRALEVFRMTGKPLSSFHRREARPAFPMMTVALVPEDRKRLHELIEKRFDVMLAAGFLDEVKGLMARPDFDPESPAMRAVGYRQAIEYLEGRRTYDEFRLAGIAATRQLAKRQLTWLRSMENITRVDPFEPSSAGRILTVMEDLLVL